MTIRPLGDTALRVDVASAPGPEARAAVGRVLARLHAAAPGAVGEVVPGLIAVAVHARAGVGGATLRREVEAALDGEFIGEPDQADGEAGRVVTLPVCYGGEYGPDLEHVARTVGLTVDEVVARHAAGRYRVDVIGFAPGFPYLSGLAPELHCARRAQPRVRVPAGSVGIGGTQTGVYPLALPGGWNLVGRTPLRLFDPGNEVDGPALLRVGDEVRIRSVDAAEYASLQRAAAVANDVAEAVANESDGPVQVLQAGMQTTVQDAGRPGWQAAGVTVGGAMDLRALRLANVLVGNRPDAAALEWTVRGPKLQFHAPRVVAVGGVRVEGVPCDRPVRVEAGEVLDLGRVVGGHRGILAWAGGVGVPRVLGSRSTHLGAGFGGFRGRPLRSGDRLGWGESDVTGVKPGWYLGPQLTSMADDEASVVRIRVMPGPEWDWFDPVAWQQFTSEEFRVEPQSDRMGVRLGGTKLPVAGREMVSQPVVAGAVQVPPNGAPLVLMADRQSLGGYPCLAVVIAADLGRLAQVRPGRRIRFEAVDLTEAERVREEQAKELGLMAAGLVGRWERKS